MSHACDPGLTLDMSRPKVESDQPAREVAQQRQAEAEAEEGAQAGRLTRHERTGDDPPLRAGLRCLNQPRRPLLPPLHRPEVAHLHGHQP